MLETSNPGSAIAPNELFQLRFVRDARLSPDGSSVAFAVSRTVEKEGAEYCELEIRSLARGDREAVMAGPIFATAPRWSPQGDRLAFLVIGAAGGKRIRVFDTRTREIHEVTPTDLDIQGVPTWSPDGTKLAACVLVKSTLPRTRISRRVFRLEGAGSCEGLEARIRIFTLQEGSYVDFDGGPNICTAPKWAPHGSRILVLATSLKSLGTGQLPRLCMVDAVTGEMRDILSEPWAIEAAEWSPNGTKIVVAGSRSSQAAPAAALWVVEADGSNAQCRTDASLPHVGFRFHHDMPIWDMPSTIAVPSNQFSFITVQAGGQSAIYKISLSGPISCEQITQGNRSCVLLDACPVEHRVLFWMTAFSTPSELCVAHWEDEKSERQITDLNSEVMRRWPTMHIEHLKFPSADGLQLEGWFMAREAAEGPQPTIMFIHGGPYMAVGCVFRFDFWMLAAHGYAVLFANFRGSLGYGPLFSAAIDPDWGTQGFGDHMAVVDAAIQRGLANKQRLGVWGPSHGGFATAWIVGHTDRFRAAVAEASAPDFRSVYYLSDLPDFFADRLGGKPNEVPGAYESRSPLTYAHQCKTPTLLLHSEKDVRCPLVGAESFFRALLDAGCPTELVVLKDSGHMGDSGGPLSARVGQNEALLEWFERYL